MKAILPLVACASLALTACEDGAPEQNVTRVKAQNPFSDQLKGMSELYRYLGLRRAIMDSGQRCKRVEAGAYQQDYKSMAMWTAHCTDSGDWAIFIAPTGDVQARRCAESAQLKLPECRVPAGKPGAPATSAKAPPAAKPR